jgi:hypothetical protein
MTSSAASVRSPAEPGEGSARGGTLSPHQAVSTTARGTFARPALSLGESREALELSAAERRWLIAGAEADDGRTGRRTRGGPDGSERVA